LQCLIVCLPAYSVLSHFLGWRAGTRAQQLRMWSSPLFWIFIAIAVFLARGANNRLMRLRSSAVQAFGSLDAHLVRTLALLGEFGAAHSALQESAGGVGQHEMAALQGAATQLSASLAVARARPLRPQAISALGAARDVLQACWHKAVPGATTLGSGTQGAAEHDGAPSPSAATLWQARWDDHALHNDLAIRVFNEAVLHYNAAITQFPANLLAWVFGFRAARTL
jgi:LemA protein